MNRDIRRRILQVLFQLILLAVLLFVSAGRLNWFWGWVYTGMYIAYIFVNMLVLPADVIAERGRVKQNVKKWDKKITSLSFIPGLGLPVIAGLDERFGWSVNLPASIHVLGISFFILGSVVLTWAMISNHYFSTMVRIQSDRDHKVADGGPYRFVRHPGYAGMIIISIGACLMLDSLWALIPSGATTVLFIIRTALEDQTLQQELDGYREFATRTKYRLVPRIW